jgi:DNA-binding transcriptional LysR family regulator
MTLLQLQYVLTIARCGSMNKAAEQLYVAQPTLTNALRELENEAGIKIFTRTNRGVELTSEGSDFLHYARQVWQQYELLEQKYIHQREVKRKFAVSTQHYSFVTKAFVEMVKQFDTTQFEFAIRETRTAEVIHDVAQQRSELGVLFRSKHNRRVLGKMLAENGLEFYKLVTCNAYVYLWKGHPLAGEPSLSLRQLEPYPCLSFEQGGESSSFLAEEILSEREYPRAIRTTDRATMLNLMIGLSGYTLCSGIVCEELNGNDYVTVPYREEKGTPNVQMEIGYIKKQGAVLDEIGEVFLREVHRYLDPPGPEAEK